MSTAIIAVREWKRKRWKYDDTFIRNKGRYSYKLINAEKKFTPQGDRLKAKLTPVVDKFLKNEHYKGKWLFNQPRYDPERPIVSEPLDPFSPNTHMRNYFWPVQREEDVLYKDKEKKFVPLSELMMVSK